MQIDAVLFRSFCDTAGEPPLSPDERRTLPADLATCYQQAQAAWPGVSVDPATFAAALGERVASALRGTEGGEKGAQAALGAVHSADVYLCCAVAAGDATGQAAFAQLLDEQCQRAAATRGQREQAGELRQRLSERLLGPGDGGRPRLLDYSGAGPLGGYLRIAALRLLLNLRRDDPARRQESLDDHAMAALGEAPDAETRLLRERYRDEFQRALRASFAALPQEQRNVMRLHYAGGLSGQAIARMLQVDRSTVVRWLAAARTGLMQDTRRRLRDQLRLGPSELESLINLLLSQLELSITSLLSESPVR